MAADRSAAVSPAAVQDDVAGQHEASVQDDEAAPAAVSAGLHGGTGASARVSVIAGALSAVGVGVVAAYLLWRWLQPPPPTPVEGLGVFAALYVLAQAIERMLEPFSQILLPSARLAQQRVEALAALESDPADPGRRQAVARAQAALEQRRADRAVAFWAAATVLGLVATAVLGLRLLALVGITTAPAGLEIVVTGLAIGGGSKPLHDLITRLEKDKSKSQDTAGAG